MHICPVPQHLGPPLGAATSPAGLGALPSQPPAQTPGGLTALRKPSLLQVLGHKGYFWAVAPEWTLALPGAAWSPAGPSPC